MRIRTLPFLILLLAGCRGPEPAPAPAPAQAQAPAPAAAAQAAPVETRALQALNAALWQQQAAEAKALSLQAWALARLRLDEALADPTWTAAEEQQGDFAALPPAVIVDVDETILDNSFYQARAIRDGEEFDQASWTAWCNEARAPALPGAQEFCAYARSRGVTVFYVTNRIAPEKEGTRQNLLATGFPLAEGVDTIRVRVDRSDKGPRRAEIAGKYRILLLAGDAATDFSSAFGGRKDNQTRIDLVRRAGDRWGTRWIVLPNPMYGSWADFHGQEDQVEARFAALRTDP